MALDKWQLREVAQYARDNDVTEAEALEALHPEAPARKRTAAKVDTTKTPA